MRDPEENPVQCNSMLDVSDGDVVFANSRFEDDSWGAWRGRLKS